MDLPSLTIDASAAENTKMPHHDHEHVVEEVGPGELIQQNSTMVTIYIGPEKVSWVIHEAILCNASRFFKDAFQGNFAEGTSKTMHLEEDDPKVFKLFVDFLFNSQAVCNVRHEICAAFEEHLLDYYALEIFADKIGLKDLGSNAVGLWYECISSAAKIESSWRTLPEAVKFVYEKCPTTSGFRSHLVEYAVQEYMAWEFGDFEYWGGLMASNASFAEECGRELKAHIQIGEDEAWHRCQIDHCSAHHSQASGGWR